MRLVFAVLLVCMWAVPSRAQQTEKSLCQQLSTYVSVEGVEFKPDEGEVPADLNAIRDSEYGSISIPIEINLAEYFNRPDLRAVQGLDLEPEVTDVVINQDGSIYYNGQEISEDIKEFCDLPEEPKEAKRKSKPKPKPVVKYKPKAKPKPKPQKSSVKVFNGPKVIISDVPEIKPEIKPKKSTVKDENAIDVEVLNTQDNTDKVIKNDSDDDSIIEGQYP